MQRHASSLACNKGDYSWFLQSEERIQEASGYCEIAQSSTKSVVCVYSNADYTTTQPRKFFRRPWLLLPDNRWQLPPLNGYCHRIGGNKATNWLLTPVGGTTSHELQGVVTPIGAVVTAATGVKKF